MINLVVNYKIEGSEAHMELEVQGVVDTKEEGELLVMYLTVLHLLQTDELNDLWKPEAEATVQAEAKKVRAMLQHNIDENDGLMKLFGIGG